MIGEYLREIVLIHVHEGTIVHAFSFTRRADVEAFEARHRSSDDYIASGGKYVGVKLRNLPDGTLDDPDSDTWVEVEGFGIEYVDGSRPEIHECTEDD